MKFKETKVFYNIESKPDIFPGLAGFETPENLQQSMIDNRFILLQSKSGCVIKATHEISKIEISTEKINDDKKTNE